MQNPIIKQSIQEENDPKDKEMNINNEKQMEIDDVNMDNQIFQNILKEYGYKIIKNFYKTKNGELFLISDKLNKNEENLYFLNKIDIKSEEEKKQIEKEIDNLKKIDSKYIIKINEHYFITEKEKEFLLIIFNYYENNLYNSNFLNSRNIWKIFIQIILGLNALNLNNILSYILIPQNI